MILKNEFISQRFYKENKSHPSVGGSGRRIIAAHSLLFLWIIQSEETNSVDTNYWPVEEYFCLCVFFFIAARENRPHQGSFFLLHEYVDGKNDFLCNTYLCTRVCFLFFFYCVPVRHVCPRCMAMQAAVAPVPPLQQSLTPEPRQLGYRRKSNLHI